jgi:hypothetical protein
MRPDTPKEKLERIENILTTLDRMIESPHWQKTGVDELRLKAINKIKEVVF